MNGIMLLNSRFGSNDCLMDEILVMRNRGNIFFIGMLGNNEFFMNNMWVDLNSRFGSNDCMDDIWIFRNRGNVFFIGVLGNNGFFLLRIF